MIIRIRDPKTTALIFASGKMVCTGAKNEQASKQAARKYARIIQKLGFNVKFKDFKVQNIVASCDVKFSIKLEKIQQGHSTFCTVPLLPPYSPLAVRAGAGPGADLQNDEAESRAADFRVWEAGPDRREGRPPFSFVGKEGHL